MNLILMRAGFPIAIITKEDRIRYYDALEESQSFDLTPFMALPMESVEEYEFAAEARGNARMGRKSCPRIHGKAKGSREDEVLGLAQCNGASEKLLQTGGRGAG